jgi:hypothetical protein
MNEERTTKFLRRINDIVCINELKMIGQWHQTYDDNIDKNDNLSFGLATILLIMSVSTFITDVILYIQSNLSYRSPLSNGHFETRPTNITI